METNVLTSGKILDEQRHFLLQSLVLTKEILQDLAVRILSNGHVQVTGESLARPTYNIKLVIYHSHSIF